MNKVNIQVIHTTNSNFFDTRSIESLNLTGINLLIATTPAFDTRLITVTYYDRALQPIHSHIFKNLFILNKNNLQKQIIKDLKN